MKAAIVILNFNGVSHLRNFLPSVVAHCPEWADIYIADNASTDQSIAFLNAHYPQIPVIKLAVNHGFAGGYNEALKQIEAEYYALINNDLEVSKGWLHSMVNLLDGDPEIAAVQPKIRSYEQRDYFEYAGASGGFIDKHGYPFCRGRLFNRCERDIGQHDDTREVFWATGACFVIRSSLFHDVGGFDERLFAHMEEIDLCWRLKNRGHRIYCLPSSVVYHLGGGTLNKQQSRKTYLNFRNNLVVIIKNDYRERFLGKLLKRMVLDGIAAFQLFFSRGPRHFIAVLRAHLYIYLHLGRLRAQRRKLQLHMSRVNRTGLYKSSIVLDFFWRKKRVFSALESALFVRTNRRHQTENEAPRMLIKD